MSNLFEVRFVEQGALISAAPDCDINVKEFIEDLAPEIRKIDESFIETRFLPNSGYGIENFAASLANVNFDVEVGKYNAPRNAAELKAAILEDYRLNAECFLTDPDNREFVRDLTRKVAERN